MNDPIISKNAIDTSAARDNSTVLLSTAIEKRPYGKDRLHRYLLRYFWYRWLSNAMMLLQLNQLSLLSAGVSFWLVVFFVVPVLYVLRISFSFSLPQNPPYSDIVSWNTDGGISLSINLQNYANIISDNLYLTAAANSFVIAFGTMIFATLIGYPLALAIHRSPSRAKPLLLFLIMIPFVASFLLRIYGWMIILRRGGLLSTLLEWLHLSDSPIQFLNNPYAALLGMVYIYVPFAVLPIYAALERIPRDVLEVASDLGASPLGVFWRVTLPMSRRGVVTAAVMVFIPCMGDFATLYLMGSKSVLALGQIVWIDFFTNRDWPQASAVASALIAVLLVILNIVLFTFGRLSWRKKRDQIVW